MAKTTPLQQIPPALQTALTKAKTGGHGNEAVYVNRAPTLVTTTQWWNKLGLQQASATPQTTLGQDRLSKAEDLMDPYSAEEETFNDPYGHAATSRVWNENEEEHLIRCWIDPSSISWGFQTREASQRTVTGEIRFRWKTLQHGWWDFPTATITFQTGNMMSRVDGLFGGEVPPGLEDLYKFFSLLKEPTHLGSGANNYHIVQTSTPMLPSVVLQGYFKGEDPITLEETAEGDYGKTWSSQMVVYKMTPHFSDVRALERAFGTVVA